MKPRRYAWLFSCCVLSGLLFSIPVGAADNAHPLRPVDTSSPRESLRNFTTNFDGAYIHLRDAMTSHMDSGRLYLDDGERRKQQEAIPMAKAALQSLDVSGVLPI
ncbi:MAG: hypothetical protein AB7H71_03485, partial [Alphaproteobacteria bacterium]